MEGFFSVFLRYKQLRSTNSTWQLLGINIYQQLIKTSCRCANHFNVRMLGVKQSGTNFISCQLQILAKSARGNKLAPSWNCEIYCQISSHSKTSHYLKWSCTNGSVPTLNNISKLLFYWLNYSLTLFSCFLLCLSQPWVPCGLQRHQTLQTHEQRRGPDAVPGLVPGASRQPPDGHPAQQRHGGEEGHRAGRWAESLNLHPHVRLTPSQDGFPRAGTHWGCVTSKTESEMSTVWFFPQTTSTNHSPEPQLNNGRSLVVWVWFPVAIKFRSPNGHQDIGFLKG